MLSPGSDCIPGRRGSQFYLNVKFVEGGDRRCARRPCYFNFILHFYPYEYVIHVHGTRLKEIKGEYVQ